ncbi:MAG: 2Fe-2S iron-sulfur cluster-binding protein [Anaerolineae bacterium]|nr:2Fe-2S iron-sulfur cluster-binding protein [Anaerolineae bacterium]MCO5196128.1 2Fe-2S iron-sulfur cluster-binding protein [Anaerolineae bacterium]MCO5196638.1 2Fe-2S iron-sulfur cluster-binding protein [Anaerolineae bacterium]MCO5207370.1 2Fe-2S iron-sulfur cluster-binding protein [Anaerolineae bacterium]
MSDTVTLTIDGQEITVSAEATILEAAAQLGIDIPVICYHPHLTANGLCRVCSVDAGGRLQAAACVTQCRQGMQVETNSDAVRRGRRTILELLASTVDLEEAPEILALVAAYSAEINRFSGAKRESPVYDDNPFYLRDYNQCVNCWRCVQVCAEDAQYAFALNFDGRGFHTTIGTYQNNGMMDTTCVFCGQCVGVCPTGALKPKRQAMLEEGVSPDEIFYQTRRKGKAKRGKKAL